MRVATGEIEEDFVSGKRRSGQARAEALSPERRSEIARQGGEARRKSA